MTDASEHDKTASERPGVLARIALALAFVLLVLARPWSDRAGRPGSLWRPRSRVGGPYDYF